MNKKANLVMPLIIATLAVILIANLVIPTVKQSTQTNRFYDTYTKVAADLNETHTTTYANLGEVTSIVNGTYVLLEGTNYTADLVTGDIVFIADKSAVLTYTITATYKAGGYLESAGDRALMAVVILACIIGIVYFLFSIAGVAGKND